MLEASALFRVLGDPARLRLLRALSIDRFNVTELTGILGLAQSGVSRHLGLLKDAGLVSEERDGIYVYYRLARAPGSPSPLWELLDGEFSRAAAIPDVRADDARIQEVRRLRRENFDQHAGADTRDGRQLVPGRSWAAWSRALGLLLPPLDVIDIGCGEGYLTIEAARWARRVVGVDRSPAVLARARQLAERRRVTNITWKRGEIERVPAADASFDVALLSQTLHHAADPGRAVHEAARVLRPGGRVLILDLRTHDESWVRHKLGDRWQGFDDETLSSWLTDAGLITPRVQVGARGAGDPFVVLVACATRPDTLTRAARGSRARGAVLDLP
ncbi:MAG: metalloregulator ArsR/SmtB family transcription factor [Acidobacteria bacterium]|nr:metalloregulator ArsR/SmtB family transcription factor [Acidobacteriota bacterium]